MNPSSCPNIRELLEFERQTANNARTALNNFLKQSPKPWCRVEYYEKNDRSGNFFEGFYLRHYLLPITLHIIGYSYIGYMI